MRYIDVSEHQGEIDWLKVKGNIDGAIIRAGYGQGCVDKFFHRNAAECARLKIPMGAYWFSYAYTPEMARKEAVAFLSIVRPYEMELPLAYDYEYKGVEYGQKRGASITQPLVRTMTTEFCGAVESAGYWCMLYANPDFIARYFGELAGGRYDLWLAQWPKLVNVANPPRKCGIWQWGGSEIPGVNGKVDTNESYKDYASFLRKSGFNGQKTAPEPWYSQAMDWARDNGIMDGTRPDDMATRAEVAQMFYNLMRGIQDGR